ncbi:MAG TPA: N-methyl-L-tryptophan oxidase [Pirellulales bacterium]|jgi:sarcosine oxidase|nr:N-methyl-L-tryptophan oxidase [Pirellulales bacterium]
MKRYDAIVLGVGGVGSAALYHLARRGRRVLGIDRFPPGHDRGSSHGQTRIIRQAYFEHAGYVPLVLRAWQLWDELGERRGERLYEQVGLIQIGPPEGEVVSGVLESARMHGLEVERLTATDVMRRWPGFRTSEEMAGAYERRAGYLKVEACVLAHTAEAVAAGAELHCDQSVLSWQADGGGVVVVTDRETLSADKLVISAGPWAAGLLGDFAVRLEVLRKPVFWLQTQDDSYRAERGCPCFLYELPSGVFYGIPQIDDHGVKVAEHSGGQPVGDPLHVDRALDEDDRQRATGFVTGYLPRATTEVRQHSVCMYTVTPDRDFIVDRHPSFPQVTVIAGLSGHGFKFAPVLGEIAADLVIDGDTPHPIDFLSMDRFHKR